MHAEITDPISEYHVRIRRHRARHAVRVAGLPLYRRLVDRAEELLPVCASLGDVAVALRITTARLPQ